MQSTTRANKVDELYRKLLWYLSYNTKILPKTAISLICEKSMRYGDFSIDSLPFIVNMLNERFEKNKNRTSRFKKKPAIV